MPTFRRKRLPTFEEAVVRSTAEQLTTAIHKLTRPLTTAEADLLTLSSAYVASTLPYAPPPPPPVQASPGKYRAAFTGELFDTAWEAGRAGREASHAPTQVASKE
jgi:hypothetical protein